MTARNSHLLRTYGITEEQYNELLAAQGDCCAICKKPAASFKKNLCVDHDHVTKEIRGIVCLFCNLRVLGKHRNALLFKHAYEYLLNPTGLYVPDKKKRKRRKRKH